jgi:hypothetical protein
MMILSTVTREGASFHSELAKQRCGEDHKHNCNFSQRKSVPEAPSAADPSRIVIYRYRYL